MQIVSLETICLQCQILFSFGDNLHEILNPVFCLKSGPSYSKLMMSLVNDSLKFTSSDTQIF